MTVDGLSYGVLKEQEFHFRSKLTHAQKRSSREYDSQFEISNQKFGQAYASETAGSAADSSSGRHCNRMRAYSLPTQDICHSQIEFDDPGFPQVSISHASAAGSRAVPVAHDVRSQYYVHHTPNINSPGNADCDQHSTNNLKFGSENQIKTYSEVTSGSFGDAEFDQCSYSSAGLAGSANTQQQDHQNVDSWRTWATVANNAPPPHGQNPSSYGLGTICENSSISNFSNQEQRCFVENLNQSDPSAHSREPEDKQSNYFSSGMNFRKQMTNHRRYTLGAMPVGESNQRSQNHRDERHLSKTCSISRNLRKQHHFFQWGDPNSDRLSEFISHMVFIIFWSGTDEYVRALDDISCSFQTSSSQSFSPHDFEYKFPVTESLNRNSTLYQASPEFIQYTKWLLETMQISCSTGLLALFYLHRLRPRVKHLFIPGTFQSDIDSSISCYTQNCSPGAAGVTGSVVNGGYKYQYRRDPKLEYRLFTISLVLANKYLDDHSYSNRAWADVTGLDLRKINIMELEFMKYIDYQLLAKEMEYVVWIRFLESYIVPTSKLPSSNRPVHAKQVSSIVGKNTYLHSTNQTAANLNNHTYFRARRASIGNYSLRKPSNCK